MSPLDRLVPPPTKSVSSVARIADDWYVVAEASALRDKPLAVTLLGTPMVVFRGASGRIGALLDRCPHRNAPLSLGGIRGDHLECGYHGWRFDSAGRCRHVPGLCGNGAEKAREVASYPACESDGFIWVYPTATAQPVERRPYRFPYLDDRRYSSLRLNIEMEGTLHATAENALDVPHTAFLHAGLFRSEAASEIEVIVRRWHDRVEAEYIGERRPEGWLGRLLAPRGGVVQHHDRFVLPCIAQVEYRLGDATHIVASSALTPTMDARTHLWGVASFRLPGLPRRVGALAGQLLRPLALRILRQDATMLREQTKTIARFGGEQFMSTEVDILGPHILRLLRQGERGQRGYSGPSSPPDVRRFRMRV